jgi:crotonobetainyl-CoA:carnitine CoA-transferase CaiB-like acyl-CoA transferase
MFDAALAFHWPDGMNEFTFLDGSVDSAPPMASLYRVQKTQDGFIATSAITNEQFQGYCRAFGRPELASDPRLATLEGRVRNAALLRELRSVLETQTTATWCERFLAEDVPHGPVLRRNEVLTDAQVALSCIVEYGATGKRTRAALSPCRFGSVDEPFLDPVPAPDVGEHTHSILSELGLSAREIDVLEAERVIQRRAS